MSILPPFRKNLLHETHKLQDSVCCVIPLSKKVQGSVCWINIYTVLYLK